MKTEKQSVAALLSVVLVSCNVPAEEVDVEESESDGSAGSVVPDLTTYSCSDLVTDVISMSKDDDVKIIKIYNPVEVRKSKGEILCGGTALMSDTSEAPGYFKAYLDRDLDLITAYEFSPGCEAAACEAAACEAAGCEAADEGCEALECEANACDANDCEAY